MREKLNAIEVEKAAQEKGPAEGSVFRSAGAASTTDAYYTVDKKEVAERHWPDVCEILSQFGFQVTASSRKGAASVSASDGR